MAGPRYLDPQAPVSERVEDLLGRMSLAEKGQQLNMLYGSWGAGEAFLRHGRFDEQTAARTIPPDGQGSLSQRADNATPKAYAESSNATQRFLAEHTRLGIPALFISETLHGLVGPAGATVFPQAIGLAATWDPALLERIGATIAAETRAVGSHVGLSPVLDVCRDPRWGRLEETYGEDPYLVCRLGVAMVTGMQAGGLIATLKHFAGHGAPQGGRDSAPVGYGREFLREFALPPFEAAVREAGAGAVMAAYSDWCYVPCAASRELLTGILREQWGFGGFVIEDMGAVRLLRDAHAVVADLAEAARVALAAGVDQSFASELGGPAAAGVKDGTLDEHLLDQAVQRILAAKFAAGLFENPYVDPAAADAVCDQPEHRALALAAARESIVLLKNDPTVLPLDPDLPVIAVIGPNADTAECGDYSGRNPLLVTPLAGIRARVGPQTTVLYAKGCDVLSGVVDTPTVVDTKYLTPRGTARGFAPEPGATGLTAEYFDSPDLAGAPTIVRVDATIALEAGRLPAGARSARWSGVLVPEVAGAYNIAVSGAGGIRLILDGRTLLDSSGEQPTRPVRVDLAANEPMPIVVEYRCPDSPEPAVRLLWSRPVDDDGIEEAVRIAGAAHAAVVVVGGSSATSGEIRDISDLELTGRQAELIRAVHATGTPTIVVHVGGRPNTMEWAFDNVPAVLTAWNPGEEGGTAIADVLFGGFNPCGKLPTQWPAATGQLPSTYDYTHTGRNERGSYVDGPVRPRFPFGHGLSYTRFAYGEVSVPDRVGPGEDVPVTVDVANIGDRAGVEVVQLYVRDLVASVKRPLRQLKGFRRVPLEEGERATVAFTLTADHLALWNARGERVVEPGEFVVIVGGDSAATREARFRVDEG
jgi:beta-glucosidase